MLRELPKELAKEGKFVFGLFLGEEMIGCADVLRGYPVLETAFLGLLLIREPWQRRGLGTAAYAHLELQIRGRDWQSVRLAVVEAIVAAMDFWYRLGFKQTGERQT